MLLIGKILRAHGVRGEVKAECFTDTPDCFLKLKKVCVGAKETTEYSVERARASAGFALLKLEGVSTASEAELLRGKDIFAEKSALPPLPKGRHYVSDLIGCEVFADEKLGLLAEILNHGSKDVYVVRGGDGKEVLFPLVDGVISDIDIDNKKITLDVERFKQVAVYNED